VLGPRMRLNRGRTERWGDERSTGTGHATTSEILPEPALFVGGERVTSTSAGTMERVNPTTGQPLGEFPVAGEGEVDRAVRAASQAFPEWKRMTVDERRQILFRIARLVEKASEEIKTIV